MIRFSFLQSFDLQSKSSVFTVHCVGAAAAAAVNLVGNWGIQHPIAVQIEKTLSFSLDTQSQTPHNLVFLRTGSDRENSLLCSVLCSGARRAPRRRRQHAAAAAQGASATVT